MSDKVIKLHSFNDSLFDWRNGLVILRGVPYTLKPLEFHENSIVVKGIELSSHTFPHTIVFKSRDKEKAIDVVDSLVTPEVAIFYLSKNPKKYIHCKKCLLVTAFSMPEYSATQALLDRQKMFNAQYSCNLFTKNNN